MTRKTRTIHQGGAEQARTQLGTDLGQATGIGGDTHCDVGVIVGGVPDHLREAGIGQERHADPRGMLGSRNGGDPGDTCYYETADSWDGPWSRFNSNSGVEIKHVPNRTNQLPPPSARHSPDPIPCTCHVTAPPYAP